MEKLAFKASQGVPEGFLGHDPDIPMPEHDPERARALLAEAGYGDGFKTVLACPNDRYINDQTICQAIGQMWNRIGLAVDIETMPKAVYFGRMLKGEFPTYMLGGGNNTGDSIYFPQRRYWHAGQVKGSRELEPVLFQSYARRID